MASQTSPRGCAAARAETIVEIMLTAKDAGTILSISPPKIESARAFQQGQCRHVRISPL